MDPPLSAVVIGAKIKRLGASPIGAKLLTHVVIDAELAVTWQLAQRQMYWCQAWCQGHWHHAWCQYNWCRALILTLTPLNFNLRVLRFTLKLKFMGVKVKIRDRRYNWCRAGCHVTASSASMLTWKGAWRQLGWRRDV
jgi:hypothetical protein